MKRTPLLAIALAASFLFASEGLALERTARQVTDEGRGEWSAGATCVIQYYNICTGWVWVLSGFQSGERVGTVFTGCDPGVACTLDSTYLFFVSTTSAGWGFTGTLAVHAADASDCPTGTALASQSFLPDSFWNLVNWGGVAVPDRFVVDYRFAADQGLPIPHGIGADHPAAGPTGPQPCGACYPTTRANHSYRYGTAASPLCPGSIFFNDGVCDAQLLFDAAMSCASAVVPNSWANVKHLYR